MASNELSKRIAVAAVGIPVGVLAVYAGGWVLGALLALIAAGGVLELYRMAALSGVRAFEAPGAVAAAGYVLIAVTQPNAHAAAPFFWVLTMMLLLAVAIAALWSHGVEGQPAFAVSITVAGALLCGATLAYAIFLRKLVVGNAGLGTALLFFPVLLTWANDTFAYFFGRAFGKHKLIPRISPGKSVEGSVAGLIGTVVLGAVYARFVLASGGLPITLLHGAIGGALVAIVAQVGDLVESMFKREAGVKDSGRLLPGHGGILDRFDSLYFTIPFAYVYLAGILNRGAEAWR
jgi:phosphatidate cytidylyltransferase